MKLIDTSLIIDYLKGKIDLPNDYVLSTISFYELYWKSLEKNSIKELNTILNLFYLSAVLPLDIESVKEASKIKVKLRKIGKEINDFDILIAGICLSNGIEEIWTKDKDFKEIENITNIKINLF